jgi:2-polyprenyl-6-methoxyphenol hydroxylase-like FAD-dependent oxidoreductase
VALIGDAAFCLSLLGGQGCALAMVAAYILAGELKRSAGDHEAAFDRYEQKLRDFIAAKQKGALALASFFAPRSRLALFLGDQVTKLMNIPLISELAVGRQIRDKLEIPEY